MRLSERAGGARCNARPLGADVSVPVKVPQTYLEAVRRLSDTASCRDVSYRNAVYQLSWDGTAPPIILFYARIRQVCRVLSIPIYAKRLRDTSLAGPHSTGGGISLAVWDREKVSQMEAGAIAAIARECIRKAKLPMEGTGLNWWLTNWRDIDPPEKWSPVLYKDYKRALAYGKNTLDKKT